MCFFSLLVGYTLLLVAQEDKFIYASNPKPLTERNYFRLGDKVLTLAKHGTGEEKPFVLLSLHNNEYTAIQTGRNHIEQYGGTFYELVNNQERHIDFVLMDQRYRFDPNRIFTFKGRQANLKKNHSLNKVTHDQVLRFAQFILNEIPFRKTIVALHNNSEEDYGLPAYKKDGAYRKGTKAVHINPALDEDDFYLTTDADIFEQLKKLNYNAVLQDNHKIKDDGSLSVYCGKVNRKYVNIETQFGHEKEQEEMLDVLEKILK